MPIVDALTATRSRAIEREPGAAPIPILAMTPNARSQHIEMSGDAACSAHFSKPISKPKLLSPIEEYGPRTKPPEILTTGSLQPIRIEMEPGLEAIVPGYLLARREELPRMIELLAISDFKGLAVLGHNLKGTGASYGFPDLTRIGMAIEDSAKQKDPEALSTHLAELQDYLGRVELFTEV